MPSPADQVIAAARPFLGDRITTNHALCEQHSHGEDTQPRAMPDAVAFLQSGAEAARLLALCHAHGVPVVPFGAGTSLEGHVTPVRGGISFDLSRMNAVLAVNASDMDCRIQAGVTRQQLNEHLRDQGLFFPVDPGSECTIGGMCATRASGTAAVRYGTIRENVLGLQVALPDGRLIETGGRVRKSATGYDLTHLMIGSEGTLGIITEIQLRLHGIPEAMSAAICQFSTLAGAIDSVIQVLQAGIPIARIELLDDVQMAACIAYSKLDGYTAAPTLLLEFHGTEAAGGRTGRACPGYYRRARRGRLPVGHRRHRPQQALARPARRLLGRPRAQAGPQGHCHRRHRADLGPDRADYRCQAGHP